MSPIARQLTDRAARLVFKTATVGSVVDHGRFRTIELRGDQLSSLDWTPGDKIRIRTDGLTLRTYTPTMWTSPGRTELLAYLPDDGPGSMWCTAAASGDACQFLGPSRSVRLAEMSGPPILVGDETTFGLASAWRFHRPDDPPAASLFEVSDVDDARTALVHHRLEPTTLVSRSTEDAHFDALADRVVEAVRRHPDAPLCLTGRAQTIAHLRRRLKDEGLTPKPHVKAYWDSNRKGLD